MEKNVKIVRSKNEHTSCRLESVVVVVFVSFKGTTIHPFPFGKEWRRLWPDPLDNETPTEFFLMRTEPPPPTPFWLQSEAEVECLLSGGTREDWPEDEVLELMGCPPLLQPPPEASVTEVVAVAAPLPLLPVVPRLLSEDLSGGCSGFIWLELIKISMALYKYNTSSWNNNDKFRLNQKYILFYIVQTKHQIFLKHTI